MYVRHLPLLAALMAFPSAKLVAADPPPLPQMADTLLLSQAIAVALAANPDLRAQRLDTQAASERIAQAGEQFAPGLLGHLELRADLGRAERGLLQRPQGLLEVPELHVAMPQTRDGAEVAGHPTDDLMARGQGLVVLGNKKVRHGALMKGFRKIGVQAMSLTQVHHGLKVFLFLQ